MSRFNRSWCALGLWLAIAGVAAAQELQTGAVPDEPALRMQAVMTGANPFRPRGEPAEFPVTVYLKGDAVRVDFAGPDGERGMLLHDAATGKGWLVSLEQGLAVPVGSAGFHELQVEPHDPCADLGLRCQPMGERFVGGVLATGWRYRNAGARGPGGTSDGDFWVDPEGVILAYRGRTHDRDEVRALRAASVTHDPLPDVLFELPETIAVPDDTPPPRFR
ncbi:hypothetical protein [Lysobacter sp. F6437]|uniref:hypothetical protein n=1 Tax=Lysobacter sp. F6437 TaxID=3459296 RepID=UPI00403DE113